MTRHFSQRLQVWLEAFRLRTIPLAVASVMLGTFLAAESSSFHWYVTVLCVLTAILLQILSNLANDYGDTVHGADSEARVGPRRATQAGAISPSAMRNALLLFVVLSLVVGYFLIRGESIFYYVLGIAAIVAAIAYTAGPKPYGYIGMGDVFVFIFFGIVGVLGTYYLHTHKLRLQTLLPAISCGCFSVAVLNINNMRDIESDKLAGKITIPVRLGRSRAAVYHWSLLISGTVAAAGYVTLNYHTVWQWLFLLTVPLLVKNGVAVSADRASQHLDPYLKQMVLTTLLFCFTFGLGAIL